MLKTTFTLLQGNRALVGQHIGDTESAAALAAEKQAIRHFLALFAMQPTVIAVDSHPAYPNRLLAADFPHCEIVEVQHHRAHIASLLAESGETGKVLGIALDGSGYGDDGTVWGGEFFLGNLSGLDRVGHLLPMFLPGGDAAAREPWRMALSLLLALPGKEKSAGRFADKFGRKGEQVLESIVQRRGGVMTTSCGRLFDGVAALLGLGERNSYEGELPFPAPGRGRARPAAKEALSFRHRKKSRDFCFEHAAGPGRHAGRQKGQGRKSPLFPPDPGQRPPGHGQPLQRQFRNKQSGPERRRFPEHAAAKNEQGAAQE